MIRARRVTRAFDGESPVLAGISLDVSRGECLVVSGARRSGKSTLLRIVATLLRPTAGSVELDGRDVYAAASDARQRVAFADPWIDPAGELTAAEYLRFSGGPNAHDAAGASRRLAIDPRARLDSLDARERVRLACAAALASRRDVIVLDGAADLVARDEALREWIREATATGSAVILEADAAAAPALDGRVLDLSNGRRT
ncbi:MAG TPA: ATP-binding cassette domain-containing protein [Vicinamibacterales bacterium]|nr:ATP-binding cassette domain-containing protein [Vicinamibacterales bacterium]